MGIFDKLRGGRIKVHILIRGRIGESWQEVDQYITVPSGTTLQQFIAAADRSGVALSAALAQSPHLADTIMLNGERCPVADNLQRQLNDGDELYLLAPLAGG
jgi:molybdopterin converting factor small subunit